MWWTILLKRTLGDYCKHWVRTYSIWNSNVTQIKQFCIQSLNLIHRSMELTENSSSQKIYDIRIKTLYDTTASMNKIFVQQWEHRVISNTATKSSVAVSSWRLWHRGWVVAWPGIAPSTHLFPAPFQGQGRPDDALIHRRLGYAETQSHRQ